MEKPLIVQDDCSMILEANHPDFEKINKDISMFVELVETPSSMHIYRLSEIAIWSAIATHGISHFDIIDTLKKYSSFGLTKTIIDFIKTTVDKFGQVELSAIDNDLIFLKFKNLVLKDELEKDPLIEPYVESTTDLGFKIKKIYRGEIKSIFIKLGYPIDDKIGFSKGQQLSFDLIPDIKLRQYQESAKDTFLPSCNGLIIVPCGGGKTPIGLGVATSLKTNTLIVTTSNSVKQWEREILTKTTISPDLVGVYNADSKVIKPITITSYDMISFRRNKEFTHLKKFMEYDWGLTIYDEVHLFPANLFRVAAIQSYRRLGLTATLIREDGREKDIFSIIGPIRFNKPWKDLESEGFLAPVKCTHVRTNLTKEEQELYNKAVDKKEKYHIAAKSVNKFKELESLLEKHKDDKVLVIGEFTDQLISASKLLDAPLAYGKTPQSRREELLKMYRNNEINTLVLSRVGNAAIDLPDAKVIIQLSYQFGSRNEEGQRVGRVTRPKPEAFFYTITSRDTIEQKYVHKRQKFLVEKGYRYIIEEKNYF